MGFAERGWHVVTAHVAESDVLRFRHFVARHLGIHLDDTKTRFIDEVLQRRLHSGRYSSFDSLFNVLESGAGLAEFRAIVRELTIPETHFFRNIDQFHALSGAVLPDLMRSRSAKVETRHLRFLSVGCASGEEPYTLAIVLREAHLDPTWHVTIKAIDVNNAVLEKATRGRFSPWVLRETPPEIQRRWFRKSGSEFILDSEIVRAVTFEERNLANVHLEPWSEGSYDVIFWRNVMMYLTNECAQAVIGQIANALTPDGYLFLGHAETLRGLSNEFRLLHTHNTFYYQRKPASQAEAIPQIVQAHGREPTGVLPSSPLPQPPAPTSWVNAIAQASERIRTLTEPPPGDATPRATPLPSASASNLATAFDLLERERFAEALERLDALPAESARETRVLVLRAALLVQIGELHRAKVACHEVLSVDELNAGAHYLLALCCEGMGEQRSAIENHQVACYLDPTFAMPRLHLGLLARRANERENARRDLGHALILLQREDTLRILMFGGGFKREALVTLCRTELVACGGVV